MALQGSRIAVAACRTASVLRQRI